MTNDVTVGKEPRHEVYSGLVDYALTCCSRFLLVVNNPSYLAPKGKEVIDRLSPFLMKKEKRSSWPGTELLGEDRATIHEFAFCPETADILKKTAAHLYAWLEPDLPEDLCFLKQDGTSWLVSISHERDAYLVIDKQEFRQIRRDLPGLVLFKPRNS